MVKMIHFMLCAFYRNLKKIGARHVLPETILFQSSFPDLRLLNTRSIFVELKHCLVLPFVSEGLPQRKRTPAREESFGWMMRLLATPSFIYLEGISDDKGEAGPSKCQRAKELGGHWKG